MDTFRPDLFHSGQNELAQGWGPQRVFKPHCQLGGLHGDFKQDLCYCIFTNKLLHPRYNHDRNIYADLPHRANADPQDLHFGEGGWPHARLRERTVAENHV